MDLGSGRKASVVGVHWQRRMWVGGTEPTSQHVCGHGVDFGFCFEHAEKCLTAEK